MSLKIGDWDMEDPMTPREVASAFGVSVKTVVRWHDDGILVAMRTLGNHRRFSRQQVDFLIRQNAVDRVRIQDRHPATGELGERSNE